ncbi:MAG: hypothetical protein HXL47_03000 [Solobacterium sp.]|nr:hypothetical protein [Solobacterium sp.]
MIHNMNKSRILILSIIGIIVISLGIYTWNHQSKKPDEDLTKYDYVVSFYSIHQNGKMNPQTKIIFVSSDQEQLEFSDKENTAGRLFQEGNTFRAYSFGGNKSLLFESSSGYSTFSMSKGAFDSNIYTVNLALNGMNGRIEVINIDDGSVGQIRDMIRYTSPDHKVTTSPVIYSSIYRAVEIGTKLYFVGYDMVQDRYELYCLDEETNEVQFVDYWYHTSVEFEELLYVNGKVITVENPYHSRFMDEEEIPEMASLTSMNPDTLEATTISLEAKRIITAYTYGDSIRVVTEDNHLLEYTTDLELVSDKDLSGTDFAKLFTNTEYKLHGIRYLGNKTAAIVTPNTETTTELGKILEYDADTLTLQKSITIPLSENTGWKTDFVDLLIIEK